MITVVGSLNMDFVLSTDKIPKTGETVMAKNFKQIPGGKGVNQADAVARLGEKVKMIGCVGRDDMGISIKKFLAKEGVNVEHILEKENVSTGVATIMMEKSGEHTITIFPGANYALTAANIKEMDKAITDSDILLIQLETTLETMKKALKIAKLAGKKTILNPAPATELSKDILGLVDILTPDEKELEVLTGIKTDSIEQVELAAETLLQKGVKDIIVTLGEKGCMDINREMTKYYPAYKTKTADNGSTRDSFNSALAVSLSKNKTIEQAIFFALKVSAMTIIKIGERASFPTMEEVNLFDTWIQTRV